MQKFFIVFVYKMLPYSFICHFLTLMFPSNVSTPVLLHASAPMFESVTKESIVSRMHRIGTPGQASFSGTQTPL